jgi:hypothetical protein
MFRVITDGFFDPVEQVMHILDESPRIDLGRFLDLVLDVVQVLLEYGDPDSAGGETRFGRVPEAGGRTAAEALVVIVGGREGDDGQQ